MNKIHVILLFCILTISFSCNSTPERALDFIKGNRFSNLSEYTASIDFMSDSIAYFKELGSCFGSTYGLAYYEVKKDTLFLTSLTDQELKEYAQTDSSFLIHNILQKRNDKKENNRLFFQMKSCLRNQNG